MVDMNNDFEHFVEFVVSVFCIFAVGNAISVFVSGVVNDPLMGNTAGTAWFAFQFLFCGFFIPRANIPDGWIWIEGHRIRDW